MGNCAVVPATPDRWDDVVAVMGIRGDPASCWCQFFRMRGAAWREATSATNQQALRTQVSADSRPPGVLAYVDGDPAGWCAVAPFAAYPRLPHSPIATAGHLPDDALDRLWAVTCFVVRTGRRRQGVAGELLGGAVDFARSGGARVVEGYPVDVTARETIRSADLYHGTLSLFVSRGFHEVARPTPGRVAVRLQL